MERTSNKSQHTKLTLEKKIVPPLLPGFELATFRSPVRRSKKQAIPAPITAGPRIVNVINIIVYDLRHSLGVVRIICLRALVGLSPGAALAAVVLALPRLDHQLAIPQRRKLFPAKDFVLLMSCSYRTVSTAGYAKFVNCFT